VPATANLTLPQRPGLHEVGDVAPTLVPELRRDVRDLSGLEEVADHLVG